MATWKEMKRDELCRQYSPSQWSHRMSADEVIKAHEASLREGTERARSITQTLLNVPYGEGQREKLDVYVPTNPSLEMPLVMYLHGGYWEALSKEESGFMAVPLVQKGVAVVAVDYDIAPGGNMDLMVSQVRQSVVSVVQQYAHISGVYLCGHSAGAHLAAMILSTDWSQYAVTPQIKGALLVSGIYNLLPILSTYVNEPLKMTEYVTILLLPPPFLPRFLLQALQSSGFRVTFEDVPDTDHFSIIERLVEPDYRLTQLLLKMMNRT
uniref:Arylformamidase n=1 Tax=Paramormyrops kingsleyae TaxID=1676925 RepID=A0A3B3SF05_9TELE